MQNNRLANLSNNGIFDYFDHAFLLNMDSDTDRLSKVSARLQQLGINFERFSALGPPVFQGKLKKDMYPGALGCARSHRTMLELGIQRGYQRFLIFEDDVVLRDDLNTVMAGRIAALSKIPWDIIYLGLHLIQEDSINDELGMVVKGGHTFAYGVTRQGAEKIIAYLDRFIAETRYHSEFWDWFDSEKSLKRVYLKPFLAIQEPNFSYTDGKYVIRLQQYFNTRQEWQEFYNNCAEVRRWQWKLYAMTASIKKYLPPRLVGLIEHLIFR